MAGKTTYTLFSYVYGPLRHALETGEKLDILFFSFEMAKEALFAKLLSLYIWDTYHKMLSFSDILSLRNPISDEDFNIVAQCKAWLETVESYITVIDKPMTPEQIGVVLRMWNEKHGKFVSLDNEQEDYIPHYDITKIAVLDHVKLVKATTGGAKLAIDDTCNEFIYYRNKCNITGIFVQQANRQSKSMDRRNGGFQLLQLDDYELG